MSYVFNPFTNNLDWTEDATSLGLGDYIKKDGTTTTTASIPFARGINTGAGFTSTFLGQIVTGSSGAGVDITAYGGVSGTTLTWDSAVSDGRVRVNHASAQNIVNAFVHIGNLTGSFSSSSSKFFSTSVSDTRSYSGNIDVVGFASQYARTSGTVGGITSNIFGFSNTGVDNSSYTNASLSVYVNYSFYDISNPDPNFNYSGDAAAVKRYSSFFAQPTVNPTGQTNAKVFDTELFGAYGTITGAPTNITHRVKGFRYNPTITGSPSTEYAFYADRSGLALASTGKIQLGANLRSAINDDASNLIINPRDGGGSEGLRLAHLTTNGFVKTSGGNGLLSIDTAAYITLASLSATSPITYNSGTGAIGFDFGTDNVWTGSNEFSTKQTKISYVSGSTTPSDAQFYIYADDSASNVIFNVETTPLGGPAYTLFGDRSEQYVSGQFFHSATSTFTGADAAIYLNTNTADKDAYIVYSENVGRDIFFVTSDRFDITVGLRLHDSLISTNTAEFSGLVQTTQLYLTADSGQIRFDSDAGASAYTILQDSATATRTITLPNATTNLAGLAVAETFTAAQKIDVNSTTALFVEQNGVKDDVLVVNTTDGSLGMFAAANSAITLSIGAPTDRGTVIDLTRTLSTRVANQKTFNMSETINWSSTATSIDNFNVAITDTRTITGGASQTHNGITFNNNRTGSFTTQSGATVFATDIIRGGNFTANNDAVYAGSAATLNATVTGGLFNATGSPTVNTGKTLNFQRVGGDFSASGGGTQTSGTLNVNSIGGRFAATGTTTGTSVSVGALIGNVSGSDTNWALISNSSSPVYLGGDSAKTYWGTNSNTLNSITMGQYGAIGDASIYYDGTDFNINPKEVGSGQLIVRGNTHVMGSGSAGYPYDLSIGSASSTNTYFGMFNSTGTSLGTFFGVNGNDFEIWNYQFAANSPIVFYGGPSAIELMRVDGGALTLSDGLNIVVNTTTGTKIGTATSQKLGFFNATPAVQQTGGAATAGVLYTVTEQTMLQTAYNCLRTLGFLS